MVTVYDYEPLSTSNDPIITQVKTAVENAAKEVEPDVAALLSVFPLCQVLLHLFCICD